MRTETIFSTSVKKIQYTLNISVIFSGKTRRQAIQMYYGFFLFLNLKLLLLKFIYYNSVYIALSLVLKGGKSGKQVAKH